jgi:hypothetical protein
MIIRAFIAMITADAIDRHLREQQHRAWVAAEQPCATAAHGRPIARRDIDLSRPERPI